MCIPGVDPLSLALTVGSVVMKNQQENAAYDQQAKMIAAQNRYATEEAARQRAFADQAQQQLATAIPQYDANNQQKVVDKSREELLQRSTENLNPAGQAIALKGYETGGGTAPTVVQNEIQQRVTQGADKAREQAEANAKLGAYGLGNLYAGINTGDLSRQLGLIQNQSAGSANTANMERNYASRAFPPPPPNPFADILGGAGNIASIYAASNRAPAPTRAPVFSPDYGYTLPR